MSRRRRILIVEDNPLFAEALEEYLKQLGVEAEVCSEIDLAAAHLAEEPPEMLLLDVCMPGVSSNVLSRFVDLWDAYLKMRNYYETLCGVDASVGLLLETLADTGQLDSTMILLMSDNGYMLGEHGPATGTSPSFERSGRRGTSS